MQPACRSHVFRRNDKNTSRYSPFLRENINFVRMLRTISVISLAMLSAIGCRHDGARLPERGMRDTVYAATLIFAGDLMQHAPQIDAARTADGFDYESCFRHIAPTLDSADAVIVNLETTLTYTGRYTGYPMFASPHHLARAMRNAGVDMAVLANNHICDRGAKGIEHTVAALDSAGIASTGAFPDSSRRASYSPLLFETGGIRFALLNGTYGTNGLPVPHGCTVNLIDTAAIERDISEARRCGAECIIACFHWGEEYSTQPSKAQRSLARWSAEHGIDIIIGSHPHVLQPVEHLQNEDSTRGTIVYYSLGNFVSNQRKRYCDGGMIARIDVFKRKGQKPTLRCGHSLVWVHTPVVDGRRRHTILPEWIADTAVKDPSQKAAYELFLQDSRRILGVSIVEDLKR